MDEFLCLTVLSHEDEDPARFSSRLSQFWTHMLRARQDDFEKVYAESTSFEPTGKRLMRRYLVAEEIVELLTRELSETRFDFLAVDRDEIFSKYEAVAPEWMQIEH